MSERMEVQFKGKTFVNITARALRKDFSLEIASSTTDGKAVLGGRMCLGCSKNNVPYISFQTLPIVMVGIF